MKLLNAKLVLYVLGKATRIVLCKNWLKYYNSSNIVTGKITGISPQSSHDSWQKIQ